MGPQVRAMVEQGGQKRRLGVRSRKTGGNGWAFESTAQPIAIERKPKWLDRKPLLEIAQPNDGGPLSPGESRTSTLYHQWSLGDVATSFALAGVSGLLAGLSSVPICIAVGAKWYWPLIIWSGSTTIVWGIKVTDFFIDRKAVASENQMDRAPESEPIVTQPQPVNLEFYDRQKKQVDRACLRAPAGNVQGLAEYADALVRGTAMPSMDGGKTTNGARSYGYTEPEFEQWRRAAVKARLLASKGKNQGYGLTERGGAAFARIARLDLREIRYGV